MAYYTLKRLKTRGLVEQILSKPCSCFETVTDGLNNFLYHGYSVCISLRYISASLRCIYERWGHPVPIPKGIEPLVSMSWSGYACWNCYSNVFTRHGSNKETPVNFSSPRHTHMCLLATHDNQDRLPFPVYKFCLFLLGTVKQHHTSSYVLIYKQHLGAQHSSSLGSFQTGTLAV